ncbi:MAG: hypothetical protein ABEJ24_01425 [Candidatus Magasanikbacteria bacterium]
MKNILQIPKTKLNFVILSALITLSVLSFLQISFLQEMWFGLIIVIILTVGLGKLWHDILSKVFRIKRGKYTTYILGGLAGIIFWGFILSFFVITYKLADWVVPISILIVSVATYYLNKYSVQNKVRLKPGHSDIHIRNFLFFTNHNILLALYFMFWVLSAYLLFNSKSTASLMSPWMNIESGFVYSFLISTLILAAILLSKHKTKTILFVILAHSLLLHSYLPLSHVQPWGGDVWRHISYEKILIQEEPIRPILFDSSFNVVNIGFLEIPQLFTHFQKLSYSFLWGLISTLAQLLQAPLTVLHKWLVPLLWSVTVPIIFFQIGIVLFKSPQKSLWFSLLSLVPFSLQALGSITSPVSFGYLIFFFSVLLGLLYLQDRFKWQRRIFFGLAVLMFFGYLLHSLLIWLLVVLLFLWFSFDDIKNKIIRVISKTSTVVVAVISIPTIEVVYGVSNFDNFKPFYSFLDFIKLISGWKYTKIIQANNSLIGNILINHTPNYAFKSTLITDYRYHVFIFSSLVLIAAIVGLRNIIKNNKSTWKAIGFLFLVSFSGYFFSWYFLSGDHLLARRLNGMIAFSLLLISLLGVWRVITYFSKNLSKNSIKLILAGILALTSLFAATSYMSGPDMRVLAQSEDESAGYVWSNISERNLDSKNHCILANTWILLRLRAYSSNKIIGGGYPIGKQFAQPERIKLLNEIKNKPSRDILQKSHDITDSDFCWIILPIENFSDKKINDINRITGSKPKYMREFAIWKEQKELKKSSKIDNIKE